uniref:Uncharacterized protein n=1 Tax=Rhizophora mucronata TaxID=61149 RepID=A0A2P2MYM8_RHIMU
MGRTTWRVGYRENAHPALTGGTTRLLSDPETFLSRRRWKRPHKRSKKRSRSKPNRNIMRLQANLDSSTAEFNVQILPSLVYVMRSWKLLRALY